MALAALACSCAPKTAGDEQAKVMARFVQERADDFIWENDLVCYRVYGEALEGNPTAPGFDVWVKTPGELVANERYRLELEEGLSYHIDRGNGKDCYKVAVSLGAGASSPVVDGQLIYPATNYRSWEIVDSSATQLSFVIHYPAWEVDGHQVSLDKKITVTAGSYFCKAEDVYSGDFEKITIAAGVFNHNPEDPDQTTVTESDRLAIWEHASDTSIEPEDGMIGVAVVMPGAEKICALDANKPHLVALKSVAPGERLSYWFGSCWSKGDIKTAQEWVDLVKAFEE